MKPVMSTNAESSGGEPHGIPRKVNRWGRGYWQLWVGIIFSGGFLILALHGIDLNETANTLRRVNVPILSLAVLGFVFSNAAKAFRWRMLLAVRKSPAFSRAFSVLSIGMVVNSFLPARLGDFTRAYLMGEAEAESKVFVLGTVALEKVSDLLFVLLSMMVLFSQMTLPGWLTGPARGTAIALAFLIPCLVLLAWQREFIVRLGERISRYVPSAWKDWLVRQTLYGLTSLDIMRRPSLLVGLFVWSLITWILGVLTNHLVFISLGISIPIWASLLLLVVLQVGTAVPSSPGRVGVFQYLVILTLSIFAMDKNVALGYSVILYLVIYVPMVLIGGYCLLREKINWQKIDDAVAILNRLRKKNK